MTYLQLLDVLQGLVANEDLDFAAKAHAVTARLSELTDEECVALGLNIHVIPEQYGHDSTEEKLYAKASDALVSSMLKHFGLTTRVLDERGDAADVVAKSKLHDYEIVADSKVFRLSRTAKNQKDFKVTSMDHWRGDAEYAAVVCPLYQYPSTSSAIYAQSLNHNVALLSFEHLIFLLQRKVKEGKDTNLASLFNYPARVSQSVLHAERKKAAPLMNALNEVVCELSGATSNDWAVFLNSFKGQLSERAATERDFWTSVRSRYEAMSREEAIRELIALAKIDSKIRCIEAYIGD
jgi:hypothetical protein